LKAAVVSDTHGKSDLSACCDACQNTNDGRSRFVIGVFADIDGAHGAAETLRISAAGNVSVLSSYAPLVDHDQPGFTELSLMSCARLLQKITHHLRSGAAVVVVHARSQEQQLGVSRALLDAKCDMLLTHDGSHHRHAD
jgi:hypothetical protein